MILPLAHHNAIQALPAFAPAIVVCCVVFLHYLRGRRGLSGQEEEEACQPSGQPPER
jgi:hypothetical protein